MKKRSCSVQNLKLLFEREYLQQELKKVLETTGANLHYHLIRLAKKNLIKKEPLYRVGNAKVNKISLNPLARQHIRKILGFEVKNYTLITGFGSVGTGYELPNLVLEKLKEKFYPISRIVCFTSRDALRKRKAYQKQENLVKIDRFIKYSYDDYRDIESKFFLEVEDILSEEMKSSDIIMDLTPLSKLFSFKLLEMANKYFLPCVYLGINKKRNYELYSMSNMKIDIEIQPFK